MAKPDPLADAIVKELTGRVGAPVTAHCIWVTGVPYACIALAGGTPLPIKIKSAGKEWEWHVDGLVVTTAPIEAYVRAELAELHVAQTVSCGPAVMRVRAGERLTCALSGGGAAFVTIGKDGATSLELALDPAAAAARGETPRDRDLAKLSKDLDQPGAGETGEEEEEAVAPGDGGAPGP